LFVRSALTERLVCTQRADRTEFWYVAR